ncbi:DDHD domain-containing protein [Phellopilus nigrolimitatus]|nr:DDHD domain-containing protein [Phellopilus nigrolimitatus]
MTDYSPPPLSVRWMRPQASSAFLNLPTAPVTASSQKDLSWQAFTAEESAECEAAWLNLSDEERRLAEEDEGMSSTSGKSEDPDDEDRDTVGVSIAKDKLFEVDVRSMQLRPIYWKMTTDPIKVFRGAWFYDDHRPVSRGLSIQLEELYLHVKPWLPSYELELSTAFEIGLEAHAKLKQPLDETQSVVFENSSLAFLVLNTVPKRFFSFIPGSSSNFRPSTLTYYPGSTPVYRGYDPAEAAAQSSLGSGGLPAKRKASEDSEDQSRNSSNTSQQKENEVRRVYLASEREETTEWNESRPPVGNEGNGEDVTDLVLIIHGIGQGLATQYEGYNFIYAANLFRQIARTQSTTPALASIMRDRRAQFLPVQWRTSFNLGDDEERRRGDAGLDNEFTLNDITIKNTVPYVRDLMNNVLIDIPYFMSGHKDQMIRAVAKQANRIYRLWCARNPGFDIHGRVHILAHSLGSSLAGHILSNQPTIQPPLSEMKLSYVKECSDLFLFNTGSFFMIGSPFPLFIHINRTQTIARKGRERTMNSPADEAFDKAGLFGCLAVDSVYNIFNPSDPIAYLLNPTVDARKAKEMPPSVIKNIQQPMFTSFSSRVSRLFEGVVSTSPKSRSSSRPPMASKSSSGFELGGPTEIIYGTKEERRFLALNPRGTLDFALPSEGNISGYFDMITAHSAYWSDPNLASFLLAEIFARKEDIERTGLGLELK